MKSLSRVRLLATPWTAAYQAPPSMGFSRQEYWSGVPLPSLILRLPTPVFLGFPGGSAGKESACNVEDLGLIPGLGRSPGEGKGCSLQYSGLENSMDYSPWGHRVRHDWGTFTSLSRGTWKDVGIVSKSMQLYHSSLFLCCQMELSLWVCLCISSSCEDTSHIGLKIHPIYLN